MRDMTVPHLLFHWIDTLPTIWKEFIHQNKRIMWPNPPLYFCDAFILLQFCFCDRFVQGVCEYFCGKHFELMPPFMSHGDSLTYRVCHQVCFSRCRSEGFRIVPFRSVFEVLYRAKKHRDQGNLNANVVAAGMARIGLMLIPDGSSRRWCKKFSYSRQMFFENQEKRAEKTSPPHACWPHWRNNCQDVPRIFF